MTYLFLAIYRGPMSLHLQRIGSVQGCFWVVQGAISHPWKIQNTDLWYLKNSPKSKTSPTHQNERRCFVFFSSYAESIIYVYAPMKDPICLK